MLCEEDNGARGTARAAEQSMNNFIDVHVDKCGAGQTSAKLVIVWT